MLAWDLWMLGHPEQALHHVLQALARAMVRADPYSVAFAHYVTSAVRLFRGEAEEALTHAEQSLAIAREHRIQLYTLYSQFGRGCALGKMGQHDQAIAEIQAGIQEARRSNLGYLHGFMLGWLAKLQADAGEPETALSTIDEAFGYINDVAGRAWEAELHRLRGDILLMARPEVVEAAERSYKAAIGVAQRQRARSFELRAIMSLARLLHRQGRSDEARRLLRSVYGWFTEGFDAADLKEAKLLLELLG